jgi:hypothetical protein
MQPAPGISRSGFYGQPTAGLHRPARLGSQLVRQSVDTTKRMLRRVNDQSTT